MRTAYAEAQWKRGVLRKEFRHSRRTSEDGVQRQAGRVLAMAGLGQALPAKPQILHLIPKAMGKEGFK